MTAAIASIPLFQFTASSGTPLVGGKLYTYQAGTTTPATTWTDQDQTGANTNPILLDGRGECRLWLDPETSYKLELRDAADALIWTVDNVSGGGLGDLANTANVALGDALVGVMAPHAGANRTTQHEYNAREIWLEDFAPVAGTDWAPALTAAFAAAQLLQGARIRVGRGEKDLNSPVYCEGSDTYLIGAGKGATIFNVNHNGAVGIGFKKVGAPGLLENVGLRDCTINYTSGTAPSPATIELLSAEYVDGLRIENVGGAKGGVALFLRGCSDVDVDGFKWDATDGASGTLRRGIVIGSTSATYTAGVKYGTGIRLRHCDIRADYTVGTATWNLETGIEIQSGNRIDIDASNTVDGARYSFSFHRYALAPADLTRRVTIRGNTSLNAEVGIIFRGASAAELLEEIRLLENDIICAGVNTISGILGTSTAGIRSIWIDGNSLRSWRDYQIDFASATITRASVNGNELLPMGVAGGGMYFPASITELLIASNRIITSGLVSNGIVLNGAGNRATVVGNLITGFSLGISIGTGAQNVTVQGNMLDGNGTPIFAFGVPYSKTLDLQGMPLAFSAYRNSTQQTSSATAAYKVLFNAENFDPFGLFDSGANSRFTPGILGKYAITASVHISNPAAIGLVSLSLYKNGGTSTFRGSHIPVLGASESTTVSLSTIVEVTSVTDYFEIFATASAAGTKTIWPRNGSEELTIFSASKLE